MMPRRDSSLGRQSKNNGTGGATGAQASAAILPQGRATRRKQPLAVPAHPWFEDAREACSFLEKVIWADGVICPHCKAVEGRVTNLQSTRNTPSIKNPEGTPRYGVKRCRECGAAFTVRIGTPFENSRLPLHKILAAIYLMTTCEKRVSARQLHLTLQITDLSARYLAHRVRQALKSEQVFPFSSDGMEMQRRASSAAGGDSKEESRR